MPGRKSKYVVLFYSSHAVDATRTENSKKEAMDLAGGWYYEQGQPSEDNRVEVWAVGEGKIASSADGDFTGPDES